MAEIALHERGRAHRDMGVDDSKCRRAPTQEIGLSLELEVIEESQNRDHVVPVGGELSDVGLNPLDARGHGHALGPGVDGGDLPPQLLADQGKPAVPGGEVEKTAGR